MMQVWGFCWEWRRARQGPINGASGPAATSATVVATRYAHALLPQGPHAHQLPRPPPHTLPCPRLLSEHDELRRQLQRAGLAAGGAADSRMGKKDE